MFFRTGMVWVDWFEHPGVVLRCSYELSGSSERSYAVGALVDAYTVSERCRAVPRLAS